MRIAILGLGRMGTPMARNLIELGHEVTLFNRTREKAEALAGPNVRVASSVADAVGSVQVALTMVTGDLAEEALTWSSGGLLEALPPGAIHLCMSTIGVGLSRRLAEAHAQVGQGYVAAPVLGKPSQAGARQIWILAGGPDVQVNRCLTILEALGRGINRVGEHAELAHALKLGANTLTVAVVEALAEVLAFGEKAGMAPVDYLRILNTGLFKSPLLDAFGGMIARRDHEPSDQTLDLAAKDLQLTLQSAHGMGVALPMAAPLLAELENARSLGLGDKDLTVLAMVRRLEAESPVVPPQPAQSANRSRRHTDSMPSPSVQPVSHPVEPPQTPVSPPPAVSAPPPFVVGEPASMSFPLIPPVPASPLPVAPTVSASGRPLTRQERRKAALPRKKGEFERRKGQARAPKGPAVPVPVVPKPLPLPAAMAHLSAAPSIPPAGAALPPGVAPKPSGAAPKLPEAAPKPPEAAPRPPAAAPKPPEAEPRLPEAAPRLPEAAPRLPEAAPRLPEAAPKPPEAAPRPPEAAPLRAAPLAAPVHARPRPEEATILAKGPKGFVDLPLSGTTHFEEKDGVVWAWSGGQCLATSWRSFQDVEQALSQVLFVKIQSRILLNPMTVQHVKPLFAGRGKVTVLGGQELTAGREATRRLLFLLGM